MSIVGLAGVSKKNTFVSGRTASRNACGSRASTIVVAIPNFGSSVSGLELAQQRRGHRRHAGRHRPARLGALQQRDPLLEHLHRRVLEPGIGHPLLLAGKARRGVACLVVAIARGEEQRLRRLAIFAAGGAAADGARRGTPILSDRTILAGLALHARRFAGGEPR
jgi:hypothetical protein